MAKKYLLLAGLLGVVSASVEAKVTVQIKGEDARIFVSKIMATGLKEKATGQGKVYRYELKDLYCKIMGHGFVGGEDMGIPVYQGCFMNSKQWGSGKKLIEAEPMTVLLEKLAEANNAIFWDSAMGKSYGTSSGIRCDVDTDTEANGWNLDKGFNCSVELEN